MTVPGPGPAQQNRTQFYKINLNRRQNKPESLSVWPADIAVTCPSALRVCGPAPGAAGTVSHDSGLVTRDLSRASGGPGASPADVAAARSRAGSVPAILVADCRSAARATGPGPDTGRQHYRQAGTKGSPSHCHCGMPPVLLSRESQSRRSFGEGLKRRRRPRALPPPRRRRHRDGQAGPPVPSPGPAGGLRLASSGPGRTQSQAVRKPPAAAAGAAKVTVKIFRLRQFRLHLQTGAVL